MVMKGKVGLDWKSKPKSGRLCLIYDKASHPGTVPHVVIDL
jgi:hypothetical protein